MTREELHQKVLTLPKEPGVYIMKNKQDQVIYVGKAKVLKNRVSQYFQNEAKHTPQTRKMVEISIILTLSCVLPSLKRWFWKIR